MRIRILLLVSLTLLALAACASQAPPTEPVRNPPPPPQYEPREAGMSPGTWHLKDGMTQEEAEASGLVTPEEDEEKQEKSGEAAE